MTGFGDFALPCGVEALVGYFTIFAVALSVAETDKSNVELQKFVENTIMKLFKKHGSDSPGKEDQRRFVIELLTKALAIAKGEEQL